MRGFLKEWKRDENLFDCDDHHHALYYIGRLFDEPNGVMYGKIILAVAVALCLTSIIRLMGLRKDKSRPHQGRLYLRLDRQHQCNECKQCWYSLFDDN